MASSISKRIFQTALFLLTFLIMMAEGQKFHKCYQCVADNLSCKKGTKDQLKECNGCRVQAIVGQSPMHANEGCSDFGPTYGPATWKGCYSQFGVERKDVKKNKTFSLLGCSYHRDKDMCGTQEIELMIYKQTTCFCQKEGCNQNLHNISSQTAQKLSPKSFLLIFPLIITGGILQKIIFNFNSIFPT